MDFPSQLSIKAWSDSCLREYLPQASKTPRDLQGLRGLAHIGFAGPGFRFFGESSSLKVGMLDGLQHNATRLHKQVRLWLM